MVTHHGLCASLHCSTPIPPPQNHQLQPPPLALVRVQKGSLTSSKCCQGHAVCGLSSDYLRSKSPNCPWPPEKIVRRRGWGTGLLTAKDPVIFNHLASDVLRHSYPMDRLTDHSKLAGEWSNVGELVGNVGKIKWDGLLLWNWLVYGLYDLTDSMV